MGAGLAGGVHTMGAAVAEEEDGSDEQGPRASESELPNGANGLTSVVRRIVREGNAHEKGVGTDNRSHRADKGRGSERAGRDADRWGPPASGRGHTRSGGLVGPAWAERPRGAGFGLLSFPFLFIFLNFKSFSFYFSQFKFKYQFKFKHVQQFKEYFKLIMMQHFMTHIVLTK